MQVQVTQICIDKGLSGDPHCCPIALALTWQHEWKGCMVGWDRVTYQGKEYSLPDSAQTFVAEYDETDQGVPFEFELGEC